MPISESPSFVKNKIARPQVRSRLVRRSRLLRRLDEALQVPLTLVCAPAGYGKTTLLVDWALACPARVAWLALEDEENDASRFLSYLILALQLVDPAVGKSALAALNFPTPEMLSGSLRLLVNDLAGLSHPAVLVLDDYHCLDSPDVHAAVAYLVEHLPPDLHLVIASRVEPPINLPRLRAQARVLELRAAELSFYPDEVEAFFSQVMALELSPLERRQLEQQTEGWAAGLQLAGLSLRSGEQAADLAVHQAGRHFIFEYLAEEVLRCQPLAVQRFLLYTSILDRMTGPLCEALAAPFLPGKSGTECLDYLEHANLFTQALDGEHRWYRYHALFAEFLREHLAQAEPQQLPRLHRQAAGWLAGQGAYEQAFKHALAGEDLDQAAGLVESWADTLERRGELAVLAQWIKALPEALVCSRPHLCLAQAWVALGRLDLETAGRWLDRAEAILSCQPDPVAQGELLGARALCAGLSGDGERARSYAEQAYPLLPDDQHYLVSLLKVNLSFPLFLSGDIAQAIRELEEAQTHALRSNAPFIALLALRLVGEAYIHVGRLSQAERAFCQGARLVEEQIGGHSILVGMAWLGLGEVYRQRNDFPRALKYLEEGIAMTVAWMPAIALDGFMWLACLKQAAGDPVGAQAAVQGARQHSDAHSTLLLDDWWVQIAAARLNIVQGYLEEALRWAHTTGIDQEQFSNLDQFLANKPVYFHASVLLTLARLYLVLGRREKVPGALEKAQLVLAHLLPVLEAKGLYGALLEALVLFAQVSAALEQPRQAQELLHRALDLGAPERPLRVFLDEGDPLRALLEERRALDLPGDERAYLEALLAAWGSERPSPEALPTALGDGRAPISPAKPAVQAALPEPLTFRELEVLAWLAQGKSNQEIASGLVLSLNTVKKHVSTIMNKLAAKNRTQAVQTARQLGLIP